MGVVIVTINFAIGTTKLSKIPLLPTHLIVLTPFPSPHPNRTNPSVLISKMPKWGVMSIMWLWWLCPTSVKGDKIGVLRGSLWLLLQLTTRFGCSQGGMACAQWHNGASGIMCRSVGVGCCLITQWCCWYGMAARRWHRWLATPWVVVIVCVVVVSRFWMVIGWC